MPQYKNVSTNQTVTFDEPNERLERLSHRWTRLDEEPAPTPAPAEPKAEPKKQSTAKPSAAAPRKRAAKKTTKTD